MDLLSFLTRQYIAFLTEEFSDRRFCSILSCYLHRYGLITLPTLRFDCCINYGINRRKSIPTIHSWNGKNWDSEIPFAESNLPVNIRNFTSIEICYFNSQIAQFIQKMSPLFNNVVINFVSESTIGGIKNPNKNIKKQFDVFNYLLPLIKSIEGIRIEDFRILPELYSQFPNTILENLSFCLNNSNKLTKYSSSFKSQLNARERWNILINSSNFSNRSIKIKRKSNDLINENIDILNIILNWLNTKRKDGEPRILQLRCCTSDFNNNNKLEEKSIKEFINLIKKNFIESKEPINYFIRIRENNNYIENINNFKLINELTNECLEINKINNEKDGGAFIKRYSINKMKNEQQFWNQKEEKAIKWKYSCKLRRIALLHYLK
ncbi:hypothetical protein Mgra_00007166 [Meloidogyne graminicola]|uniref:Uncharacterized protein n=1 Tax=Meloidogyne graminicola TaxID=189291 RepID=A0A8S9ZJK1_9BILA|nr:hypothetical protein Mgra_00007166 [Meloidogyne graminicola]